MKNRIVLLFLIIITAAAPVFSADGSGATFRRIGVYVGANNGGQERVRLLYAGTDAASLYSVMQELGGVYPADSYLLEDPDISDIENTLTRIKSEFGNLSDSKIRTEFIFYYSGHSDEEGLLLGDEHLPYPVLKQMITEMGSSVNIAILDSCSSGVFTRLKGGVQRAPFLVDESVETSGYAFLTSSSADEAAQESDSINASFFTHYFISALRGAGDSTGDGKVTLNEAFSFASNETLTKTSRTQGGTQHPSYNINLSGSGDLVLTDLRLTKAGIDLDRTLSGRIFVKDDSGRLVAELYKGSGVPMTLSLPFGTYSISIVGETSLREADITLVNPEKIHLDVTSFRYIPLDRTRVRGDMPEENLEHIYGEITILPKDTIMGSNRVLHDYSINVVGNGHSLDGVQMSGANFLAEDVHGAQLASVFNIINGTNHGAQLAGIFNISKENRAYQQGGVFNINYGKSKGIQAAGVFNINEGTSNGVQASGIFNINEGASDGVQAAGIFNINEGKSEGVQASGIFNINTDAAHGIQAAGIFNITKGVHDGLQLSGIFNTSEGHDGGQAGLVNITEDIDGFQLGLINKGKNVKGIQVGLININRKIKGIPIGLINISEEGISDLAIWRDSTGYTYAGYQLGARNIYTIVFGGEYLDSEGSELVTGLGLGYQLKLGHVFVSAEAALNQYTSGNSFSGAMNDAVSPSEDRTVFTSCKLTAGLKLFGPVKLFGGISWNSEIPGLTDNVPELLQSEDFFETKLFDTGYDIKMYQNWVLGFRI